MEVSIQVPKESALLVHATAVDEVGLGDVWRAVGEGAVVPVGIGMTWRLESVGPEGIGTTWRLVNPVAIVPVADGPRPKQMVSRDTVADYKASVLPYEMRVPRYGLQL